MADGRPLLRGQHPVHRDANVVHLLAHAFQRCVVADIAALAGQPTVCQQGRQRLRMPLAQAFKQAARAQAGQGMGAHAVEQAQPRHLGLRLGHHQRVVGQQRQGIERGGLVQA